MLVDLICVFIAQKINDGRLCMKAVDPFDVCVGVWAGGGGGSEMCQEVFGKPNMPIRI